MSLDAFIRNLQNTPPVVRVSSFKPEVFEDVRVGELLDALSLPSEKGDSVRHPCEDKFECIDRDQCEEAGECLYAMGVLPKAAPQASVTGDSAANAEADGSRGTTALSNSATSEDKFAMPAVAAFSPDKEQKVSINMLLFCPRCGKQHIDSPKPDGDWTNPPHATHSCHFCNLLWRPSNANTNGVASLPAQEMKHIERMAAADPNCYAPSARGDTERLDWLESQLKYGWGDGFVMQAMDSGGQYVRPWRKANEALFPPDPKSKAGVWQADIRTAIDEAMLSEKQTSYVGEKK